MGSNRRIPIRFEATRESAVLDEGPGKYRIGLIALSIDYVAERNFMNMRPSDDVVIYVSRIPNTPQCNVETLHEMASHITDATSLIVPDGRLDVVAYACTSGTAFMGYDKVRSLIQAARPGIACSTPISSSMEALDRLGAQRIAVLTPYIDEVNVGIADYIQANGKTITGSKYDTVA